MKPWLARLGLGGALVVLGIWAWHALFPSPEQLIRKSLVEVAHLACIAPNEGSLVKLAKSQKLAAFFTTDAQVTVDLPGHLPQSLSGRDELMQAALSARSGLASLKVEFLDIGVTVDNARESGKAHFTIKADLPGESTPQVEELEAELKRVDNQWLIKDVHNVRTLR
jgi:hypothetical protein